MFARHFIDSLDFARQGLEFRGEAAVSELPRLRDVLAAPEGQVSFVLRGVPQGRNGKALLELTLTGSCQLRCQRCLQALPYSINTASLLMPVAEGELEGAPEGGELEEDEGIDTIPASAHMDVLDLVEEEIVLGLPLAPRHEFGACEAANESALREERSPFAVLRGLKKD